MVPSMEFYSPFGTPKEARKSSQNVNNQSDTHQCLSPKCNSVGFFAVCFLRSIFWTFFQVPDPEKISGQPDKLE